MDILPFRNATTLLQNTLNGSGDLLKPILIILGYTIIIFSIAVIIFRNKMKSK